MEGESKIIENISEKNNLFDGFSLKNKVSQEDFAKYHCCSTPFNHVTVMYVVVSMCYCMCAGLLSEITVLYFEHKILFKAENVIQKNMKLQKESVLQQRCRKNIRSYPENKPTVLYYIYIYILRYPKGTLDKDISLCSSG